MKKRRHRINLILAPERQGPKRDLFVPVVAAAAGMILLTMVGRTLWEERTLLRQHKELTARKSEVEGKIADLTRINDSQKSVDARRKVVSEILAKRTLWSNPLKELTMRVPRGIWLDELRAGLGTGGKSLEINGTAGAPEDVTGFFHSLEESYFFKKIMIDFSERNADVSPSVYKFKFHCPLESLSGEKT